MILAALTAALQFQTAAQLPWVLVFYCVAPLYCVWTTTLVLISAVKIASGRVGASDCHVISSALARLARARRSPLALAAGFGSRPAA